MSCIMSNHDAMRSELGGHVRDELEQIQTRDIPEVLVEDTHVDTVDVGGFRSLRKATTSGADQSL
jgi:hypothetical protein